MLVSRAMAEDAAESLALIGLETLDEETVNFAYKTMAKISHPDAGGSAEAFARVERAKHVLLAWLAKKPEAAQASAGEPCPLCGGRGKFHQRSGFKRGMLRQCPSCQGHGEVMDIDRTGDIL